MRARARVHTHTRTHTTGACSVLRSAHEHAPTNTHAGARQVYALPRLLQHDCQDVPDDDDEDDGICVCVFVI